MTRVVSLALLAALWILPSWSFGQAGVHFALVPVEFWEDPEGHLLTDGRVRLYKADSYSPDLVVELNEATPISTGVWRWIGEADGWVTVSSGTLSIGESCSGTRRLLWWVVPACSVSLDDPDDWKGVDRVDLVSLNFGSVYPLVPKVDGVAQIPAGRFIAYGVRAGRLVGISSPMSCRKKQELVLERFETPGAEFQDLMLSVTFPEEGDVSGKAAGEDEAMLSSLVSDGRLRAGAAPVLPTAVARSYRRVTFFFLDVPAGGALELQVEHPSYQTLVLPIESLGGSVRELPDATLVERHSMTLDVDYVPIQEHSTAEVVGFYCGRDQGLSSHRGCAELETKIPLEEGRHEYQLGSLDWGQYYFLARIDDFVLEGLGRPLGSYFRPYLPFSEPNRAGLREEFEIREQHVFGNILLDGDPIPGFVELFDGAGGSRLRSVTDHELIFHLYYFGTDPSSYGLTPEERDDGRSLKGIPDGLPVRYNVAACSETGACRYFNSHSRIRGSGRLDLEIDGSRLVVNVVDSETGLPVDRARVWMRTEKRAFLFEDGELTWGEPSGEEGRTLLTDDDGSVRFRGLDRGSYRLVAAKDGFERERVEVDVGPGPATEIQVELRRRRGAGSLHFRFPDGGAVGGAVLLPIREDGTKSRQCFAVTDSAGRARLRPGCMPANGRLVLLHPEAVIADFRSQELGEQPQRVVARRSRRPLKVRVVDPYGQPVPGLSLILHLDGFDLTHSDFLLAAVSGTRLHQPTNAQGELVLFGVDPGNTSTNGASVTGNGVKERFSLSGYDEGDTIEVFADSAD